MITSSSNQRLLSLDFFRGLIMVLLMLEGARLYDHIEEIFPNRFIEQFFHHPWSGLNFWDLIQPAFMFIAGTSLAFSLYKQQAAGVPWSVSFRKTLKRSGWLFFWGVLDYAVRPGGLSFELWDVLTQLSFTLLVAFLIFNWKLWQQIVFSIALLLLTEVLYRFTGISGFDQPFVDQHNFGNFVDLLLMNKINHDGWVAINCIPTAAHTIWGAVAGKLLLSTRSGQSKIRMLLLAGLVCLVVGYSLHFTITPIIKRISTSSFVFASGGWCFLMLAVCYWWIDVCDHHRYLDFFTIVGMNSIFIYLFFEIVGSRWFNDYIMKIVTGLLSIAHTPYWIVLVAGSLTIFSLEWVMCWFLYKKKVFFKL